MRKLEFKTERTIVMGSHDAAYLDEDEDLATALTQAVIDGLDTDLEVTVSDVTMHLAAWRDPDHWATDWAEKLGVDFDDAPGAVAELLASAVTDG